MTGSQRHRTYGRMRIIVLGLLSTIILAEWTLLRPGEMSPKAEGVTASIDHVAMRPLVTAAPSPDAYASIITNDLFAEDRQAPAAALSRFAAKASASSTSASDTRILGIVVSDKERVAIVQAADGGALRNIHIGDAVGASYVRDISPSYVVFQTNGLDRVLSVQHQAAPEPVVASASPTAPASSDAPPPPATGPEFTSGLDNQGLSGELGPPPDATAAPLSNPATGK